MYKMVSLPKIATGTKDSAQKSTQSSYRAFTTGLNRIGATINSTIVVNKQIRDALVQNLKLKDKEFEEEKKRFQKEKEEKNKVKKTSSGFLGGVAEVAAKMTGGFLSGLAGLAGALMKFVITQSVLRWIGNPANMEKLISIVSAIVKVVTFFSRFLRDNIVKMFDGLAAMLDGKNNIFQKLGGFVTFITGFGSILGAALILKKPGLVLKGVAWVLKTLYTSLFKTKGRLAKQVASQGSKGSSGGFGSWSSDQSGKTTKGGGRLGGIAKGLAAASTIAVPLVVGAQMASGPDEFSSAPGSVSGGSDADTGGGLPQLAMGGVATRPTSALIGEAGPEMRMPLDNAKRMANAGIKPLSSLGGFAAGGAKQSQKLSELFMTPFRGIGAGILASISNVVSGMPGGQMLTPIIGSIIAPIANSFGVPSSLVKNLTSKSESSKSKFPKSQFGGKSQFPKDGINKLFGKGKTVKVDDKKFKKVADTSVLGLLSNILAAIQVIGNKAGGTTTTTTTPSSAPAPSDQSDAPTVTPGAQGGGASGSPTSTAKSTLEKAGGLREDGTLKGVQGTSTGEGRGKKYSPGADLLPVENGNRHYWYNSSGDVFMWKRPGDPLTDITSTSLIDSKTLKGSLVRDLKTGQVKILQGMFGGDQTPIGYFHYGMGAILKKRGKSGGRTGNTKDEWEKPTNGRYGPTITPKASTPSKANGGWISGPQSGYPVSLDGGGSTAFIGHGTEWVGFKRAAGGSAFVVPFDTPATKNNPGLTGSRMRQAKQGGYALPQYAAGGGLTASRESASQVRKKPLIKKAAGGVVPDGPGSSWAAGIPLVSLTTKSGKSFQVAKALAPRFQGFVNELEATGYRIRAIGGYRPDEQKNVDGKGPQFAHPYGAAIDINPDTNGPFGTYNTDLPSNIEAVAKKYGLGWGRHFKDAMHFSAMKREYGGGINGQEISRASIMGSKDGDNFDPGTTPSSSVATDSSAEQPETMETVMQKLRDAVSGLNTSLGYAPPTTSVESATQNAAKAKDAKANEAKEATNKATAAALKSAAQASKQTGVQNAPVASKPVMLPGPSTIIPVELAWSSTTSLYQPKLTLM